jgi:hypothetical protein
MNQWINTQHPWKGSLCLMTAIKKSVFEFEWSSLFLIMALGTSVQRGYEININIFYFSLKKSVLDRYHSIQYFVKTLSKHYHLWTTLCTTLNHKILHGLHQLNILNWWRHQGSFPAWEWSAWLQYKGLRSSHAMSGPHPSECLRTAWAHLVSIHWTKGSSSSQLVTERFKEFPGRRWSLTDKPSNVESRHNVSLRK